MLTRARVGMGPQCCIWAVRAAFPAPANGQQALAVPTNRTTHLFLRPTSERSCQTPGQLCSWLQTLLPEPQQLRTSWRHTLSGRTHGVSARVLGAGGSK